MTDFTVVAHTHDEIGETPAWCDRTGSLWWIDVLNARLHRLALKSGEVTSLGTQGGRLGSIGLCKSGKLVLANRTGLFLFDPTTQRQEEFINRKDIPIDEGFFFNDGRCDRQGRFWVGTMHESFRPEGVLYRVTPDGKITPFASDIIVTNGIAFNSDNRTLYFADTRRFKIFAFDLDLANGDLSNRREFANTLGRPGRPDGACIDEEGYMWSAEYAGGQITRYAPDGRIDREVKTPVSHPTSVCFGGADNDTLFITSGCHAIPPEKRAEEPLAGAVLAFKPGVRGLAECRFDR